MQKFSILLLAAGLLGLVALGAFALAGDMDTVGRLPTRKTKIMLVEIHADWCPRCHRVSPVFKQLATDYANNKKVSFVVLDVTNKAAKLASSERAEVLGLSAWYAQNRAKTSMVGVFTWPDRKLIHTFADQADKQVYVDAITDAITPKPSTTPKAK